MDIETREATPARIRPARAKTPPADPIALKLPRAAALIDVEESTLRKLVNDGTIKACRVRRCLLIRVDELKRYMAEIEAVQPGYTFETTVKAKTRRAKTVNTGALVAELRRQERQDRSRLRTGQLVEDGVDA